MTSLLGSTQTFLGVIATIAILCLFTTHKEGNFIALLLDNIRDNTIDTIQKYATSIKEKASSRKSRLYKESGIDFGDESPDSYINKRVIKQKEFAKIIEDLNMQTNLAYSTAEQIEVLNEERKKIIEQDYSKRREAKSIALLVFMSSIFLLLLDSLNLCNCYIIPFTYFFTSYIMVFSFVIWMNHFTKRPIKEIKSYKKSNLNTILSIFFYLFFPFLFFVLLCVQKNSFDHIVIFAVSIYIIFLIIISLNMHRRYWHYHNYPITNLLRHFIYFIIGGIYCTFLLYYFLHFNSMAFVDNTQWLYDSQYVRALIMVVLIFNIVFIPLFGGCSYLIKGEYRIKKKYKRMEKFIDKNLDSVMERLHIVICQLTIQEDNNKNANSK